MDFAALKSRVLAIIGRAPADVCYELVTADINHMLRTTGMESTATIAAAASITLPSDFVSVVDIYIDTDPRRPLSPRTGQQINSAHVTTGIPREYAIADGVMLLNPAPAGTYNVQLRYVAKLTDLSADDDTNVILTNHPGIYVYGSLAHHSMLIRDMEAAQGWAQAYNAEMKKARTTDQNNRYSGASLAPTALWVD